MAKGPVVPLSLLEKNGISFHIKRIPFEDEADTIKFRASWSGGDAHFMIWDAAGNWCAFSVPRPEIGPNGLRVGFIWNGGSIALRLDGKSAETKQVIPKP